MRRRGGHRVGDAESLLHARGEGRRAVPAAATTAPLFLALVLALATPGWAHPLAPALLALEERADGQVAVQWKTSKLQPRGVELRPVLPDECPAVSEPTASEDANSLSVRWRIDCAAPGLVGREIAVSGRGGGKIDTLARVSLRDGRVVSAILRPGASRLRIPERQTRLEVATAYLRLGAEHILSGPDHLAFVLGLLLLIRKRRQLIETITSFTLGHSLTVSLAALGLARMSPPLVDLAIAASILVLALEAVDDPDASPPSGLRRRPWLMAVLFGLLHGMGFAGALAQVGLPDVEIPLALFTFNLGIEIGQLAFVCAVLAPLRAALAAAKGRPLWLARAPAYAIGTLAAFWCWQRGAGLL